MPGKPYWWQWPTMLSLDAPAVVLLWQWLLQQTARQASPWPHAFILGASVWLAYVADRWIEGWRLAPDQIRTQRHYFYQRHRWPLAAFWLVVLTADLTVALVHLTAAEFRAGLVLLAPVALYLLSHQFLHRHHPWRAPKELCVALLLGGGTALFPLAQPGLDFAALGVPLTLFCLLCFANCALISVWEHAVDEAHGQTSLALQYRRTRQLAVTLPWLLAFVAIALASNHADPVRTTLLCAGASGVLLGGVHLLHDKIGYQLARVLADLALMTPLLPWVLAVLARS